MDVKKVFKIKNILNRIPKSEKLRTSFLLLPSNFFLIVFFAVAIAILVLYSFWTVDPNFDVIPQWNFQNYLDIFMKRGGAHALLFLKTIGIVGLVTGISISIAYPASYWICMRGGEYKYMWITLLLTPFLISWVILVMGWMTVLRYNGLVNQLLMSIGLITEPIRFLHNVWAVVLVLAMGWTSWVALPIFVSLEKMDKTLLEAGADLGASPLQNFMKITLPLSMPGILVATLLTFIPLLGEFVAAVLVGGTSGTMYGILIDAYFKRLLNWPYGSALSMLIMVTSFGIGMLLINRVGLRTLMESL